MSTFTNTFSKSLFQQGSNLSQIPNKADALFWLDGIILDESGTKYFRDKTGNGRKFLITGYDFDSTWLAGMPYKSAATISAPVGDATLIASDINSYLYTAGTPNQIPVVSLFQDIDYEHKLFCRHFAQVVDGNGVETNEARVFDIVLYNTVKVGGELTNCQTYYGVPTEVIANVKWVDGVNGLDTNAGTKALPWKTTDKVQASVAVGDTVYFKTSNYITTNLYLTKNNTFISLGYCKWSTAGANRVIAIAAGVQSYKGFVFDGTADCANGIIYHLGGSINFTGCLFKNEKTSIIPENTGATNSYTSCIFDSRLANTSTPVQLQLPTMVNCYIKNALTTNAGNANYTNCKFTQTRTTGQSGCINFSGANSTIKGCLFNYSIGGIGFTKILSVTYCKFYAAITGEKAISSSVSTAELTANHNLFYNNDITPTPATPFFINLENPKSLDIQHNSFHSITKNQYYPIYAVTSSAYSVPNTKVNYNYILNGSFVGTIIRLNGELGYNNVFDGAEIIGNRIVGHRYLYPEDSTSGIHGMMLNGGTNMVVKFNHVSHCELGIVLKNGLAGQAYTSGGISYNKIEDCVVGIYVRGIKGLNIFNNTYRHSATTYARSYQTACRVDINTALTPNVNAENVILKNNIYDIKCASAASNIEFDAHAASTGCTASDGVMFGGSHAIKAGATVYDTVSLAQAAGWLANTTIADPSLNASLIPSTPIFGATLDSAYDDGLDVSSIWKSETVNDSIVTKQQGAIWQKGAYIQD